VGVELDHGMSNEFQARLRSFRVARPVRWDRMGRVVVTLLCQLNDDPCPVLRVQERFLPVRVVAALSDDPITHCPASFEHVAEVRDLEREVVRTRARMLHEPLEKIVLVPSVSASTSTFIPPAYSTCENSKPGTIPEIEAHRPPSASRKHGHA
jgi:hypothetical protein